jgi:uncharacterized protein
MFFKRRQHELEGRLTDYREKAALCVTRFYESLLRYLESGDLDQLREDVGHIHKAESQADDLRRDIEVMMYSKALFPESRGDVLGLLEAMDEVPNQAETCIRTIVNQYIEIPEMLHRDLRRLVDTCTECVDAMLEATTKLFTDFANAAMTIGKIDALESEADGIEGEILQKIFANEQLRDLDKGLLRDLTRSISHIADRAEAVGDRVRIIVAKRVM